MNIPDITSLSDLLDTSSVPSDREVSHSELQLDSAKVIAAPESEYDSHQETHEELIDKENETHLEKLLQRQSHKLMLSEKRNEMLKERSALESRISELKVKVQYLKDMQSKEQVNEKLHELLQENYQIFASGKQNEQHDNTDDILQNLNVLPSKNWLERLRLVRLFQEHIEIDEIRTSNEFDSNELSRILECLVSAPLLFNVRLKIVVCSRTETIKDLILSDKPMVSHIGIISPDFDRVLNYNYLAGKKVDLIMYGFNSLAKMIKKRVSIMFKLITSFPDLVDQKFSKIIDMKDSQDKTKIMATLKSLDQINLRLTKDSKEYTVRIRTEIVISNPLIGECGFKTDLVAFQDDKILPEMSDLYQHLLEEATITDAVTVILNQIFGQEIKES